MTPRHFTVTAFVVCGDSVALHWHPKVKAWLPPGGHIEPTEDSVQAVFRALVPLGRVPVESSSETRSDS